MPSKDDLMWLLLKYNKLGFPDNFYFLFNESKIIFDSKKTICW